MFARAGVERARVGTLNHQDRHPFAERGAALELFTSGSGPRILGEFCCVRWHLHAADPDDGRSDAEAGHGDADRDRLRVSDAETSCSALRSGGRAVNGWDSGAPSRSLSPYNNQRWYNALWAALGRSWGVLWARRPRHRSRIRILWRGCGRAPALSTGRRLVGCDERGKRRSTVSAIAGMVACSCRSLT